MELATSKATTDSKPKSGMQGDNPAVRVDHEDSRQEKRRERSGCTQEGSYRLVWNKKFTVLNKAPLNFIVCRLNYVM
jgi:hypothetical protein